MVISCDDVYVVIDFLFYRISNTEGLKFRGEFRKLYGVWKWCADYWLTKAIILMFSFTMFKVNVTTSYVFLVLLVVPKVVMSIVLFWIGFNCSLFLKSCVINVFCDPVSMRMRAWCHVVEPLAVMKAVCSSTFVWVVAIVARVVDVGQMSLLFCVEFSCFSVGFLFESWLGWCGEQIEVWCFNLQLRHLPLEWHWYFVRPEWRQLKHLFCWFSFIFLCFIVFTLSQLLWQCLLSQYMHGFKSGYS